MCKSFEYDISAILFCQLHVIIDANTLQVDRISFSVPICSITLLGTIHAQRLFDCSDVDAMN